MELGSNLLMVGYFCFRILNDIDCNMEKSGEALSAGTNPNVVDRSTRLEKNLRLKRWGEQEQL